MGAPMTDLPIVQFKHLTTAQRAQFAEDVFMLFEYDEEGRPGADRDNGDLVSCMYDILDRHGVRLSDASNMPAGYRINNHHRDDGAWCRWSKTVVKEPQSRTVAGDITCFDGCAAGFVEADPDASIEHDGVLDVDAVLKYLKNLGVPYDTIERGGGTHTVFIGVGVWDEDTERFTHPMSFGPCDYLHGKLTADPYDAVSYGLQEPGSGLDTVGVDYDDDPESVARGIARLYWERVPPPSYRER